MLKLLGLSSRMCPQFPHCCQCKTKLESTKLGEHISPLKSIPFTAFHVLVANVEGLDWAGGGGTWEPCLLAHICTFPWYPNRTHLVSDQHKVSYFVEGTQPAELLWPSRVAKVYLPHRHSVSTPPQDQEMSLKPGASSFHKRKVTRANHHVKP